ncbi:CBL-interacting protein kinase 10-like [Mizuhopecten yessoensis]|uniref:Testis-specific serine/threonine-protein kinase 3 n=1 Tax=Mizuhopecten yessoensis TaxID=6573 RepID=A0A210PR90_MIZYE|nr:CBL-interacting protein kinase 10-like [Mizuhopecten yessoensis]OWF38998.1 Testis-specific serine/threonine-protein kinase 3 [Mizuhopecten yessoensis]
MAAKGSPNIINLQENFSLREKGGMWSPDQHEKVSVESYGYMFGETIGEGPRSKVKKAVRKQTNEIVAIKVIKKKCFKKEAVEKFVTREIRLNHTLQHPGLLDLYSVYSSGTSYFLVMEYAPNGDLLEFVNRLDRLSEPDARRIFKQLLDIVNYLHENGVCHRDIKCENILLDDCYNIKLADFGFARRFPENRMVGTRCGSYVYTAPEVLTESKYDAVKSDIWSMGICLYAMLCGRLPYRDDDLAVLLFAMQERLKFHKHVSRDCRDLLRAMLSYDPRKRPAISSIMKTNWMCKPLGNAGESSMSSLSVAAVTDKHELPMDYNPYAEHGFSCNLHDDVFKGTPVTDVLRTVAENHSSGTSSVDLTKVAIPKNKTSTAAMVTGVAGPIGRKLSQQMGLDVSTKSPKTAGGDVWASQGGGKGGDVRGHGQGQKKSAFGKATNALATFRRAAKVVTAVKRFKRKPLNTILNMPQEEAMAKIIHTREKADSTEIKDLHFSESGKMAALIGKERKDATFERRQSETLRDNENRAKEERRGLFGHTLSVLTPDSDTFSFDY